MKVWISKYALSGGITEHECKDAEVRDGYVYPGHPFMCYVSFKLGRDAHETRDAAVKAAEVARKKKISSVRKQLERLESLTF